MSADNLLDERRNGLDDHHRLSPYALLELYQMIGGPPQSPSGMRETERTGAQLSCLFAKLASGATLN